MGGDTYSDALGQEAHLDLHCSRLQIPSHFQVIDGWRVLQVVGVFQEVLAIHLAL